MLSTAQHSYNYLPQLVRFGSKEEQEVPDRKYYSHKRKISKMTKMLAGAANGAERSGPIVTRDDTSASFQAAAADNLRRRKLANFYAGKTLLITGTTGFIGKVCLLKLMTSLSSCKKIYIMLRAKKGMSSQQRFAKMLSEAPFNPATLGTEMGPCCSDEAKRRVENLIEQIKAADWSKVQPLDGDMSRDDLGFDEQTKAELSQEVEIVFNIAASVQFDAPLKQNLRDNYMGTRNLIQLVLNFDKLISLVHVSTFYVNHHLPHVEEKVLPMNCDCEKMAELIKWLPESMLEQAVGQQQFMENRPNTYVFTKAMAENLVQKYQGQLPIAIVRPSIVVPSKLDPEPGWVDNVNGPMGLGVLASLGILRNIDWNYWGTSDFVPVDYVCNLMLAVAERTARKFPKEIKVYNCSSSSLNPTTWGECFEVLRKESVKAPPYKMLRTPIEVPKHKRANKLGFALTKLNEILFAYLIDFILLLCGQKRLLTRLTSKLHHGYEILRPFTTNAYTCSNDNLVEALDELHEDDQREFEFDIKLLDWSEGFRNAYYGARKRLLKESLDNLPAAIFKYKVLRIVGLVFRLLFIGLLCWLASKGYASLYQNATILTETWPLVG